MHIQTIKQNMHTIFVKKTPQKSHTQRTLSYLNLSMKSYKTKLKYESTTVAPA
jgi:hypothetical protein